jgi:thioredoxin-dependent peroxiredoxin
MYPDQPRRSTLEDRYAEGAVQELRMPKLDEGDLAPDFELPDQDGKSVSLGSLRKSVGKSGTVVVYFYPADDTPGCTKEACEFNENLESFESARSVVVGISPDGASKHQKFRSKYGLGLQLLSDPDHAVMSAYGAYGEKTLYGRKTVGVIRSTFVIGGDGKIRRAWYSVRADGHAAKVLEEVTS